MEFAHEIHQRVWQRVRGYLDELFEAPFGDPESGSFYVQYGTTVLEVSVEPYGPEDAAVTVMAYCVQGVELDEQLLLGLLETNHQTAFGAFSLVGTDIFFSHALSGRSLDRSSLLGAIAAVATLSDDYDDRIVAKYGGQTALDRIRETGGRERRQATPS